MSDCCRAWRTRKCATFVQAATDADKLVKVSGLLWQLPAGHNQTSGPGATRQTAWHRGHPGEGEMRMPNHFRVVVPVDGIHDE